MIERIVSGGQEGVDMAALVTAQLLDIPTGGWAPQGWLQESGPAPWLADYGLKECARPGYQARTEQNVKDSSGTLIITHEIKITGGTYSTLCAVESTDRPCYIVRIPPNFKLTTRGRGKFLAQDAWIGPGYVATTPSGSALSFALWLSIHGITKLNVAGPRESKNPGIFERASKVLMELLSNHG